MSQHLTTKHLESIREIEQEARTEGSPYAEAFTSLLAEFDRIRPEWVPVHAGRHNHGDLYQLGGIPHEGLPPRWIGRGRYDAHEERWYDEDTLRPFRFPITHVFMIQTPPELIGQPSGEEV